MKRTAASGRAGGRAWESSRRVRRDIVWGRAGTFYHLQTAGSVRRSIGVSAPAVAVGHLRSAWLCSRDTGGAPHAANTARSPTPRHATLNATPPDVPACWRGQTGYADLRRVHGALRRGRPAVDPHGMCPPLPRPMPREVDRHTAARAQTTQLPRLPYGSRGGSPTTGRDGGRRGGPRLPLRPPPSLPR